MSTDTEWVRTAGEQPGWFIPGHGANPGWGVTDEAIAEHGRTYIERLYAGLPPLPAEAWAADAPDFEVEPDELRRTTISLSDLAEALAGLDVYKPGLSYDETAEAIMNYQPAS
jgi:hypothetical protein